jgi:hypothetical protein
LGLLYPARFQLTRAASPLIKTEPSSLLVAAYIPTAADFCAPPRRGRGSKWIEHGFTHPGNFAWREMGDGSGGWDGDKGQVQKEEFRFSDFVKVGTLRNSKWTGAWIFTG